MLVYHCSLSIHVLFYNLMLIYNLKCLRNKNEKVKLNIYLFRSKNDKKELEMYVYVQSILPLRLKML